MSVYKAISPYGESEITVFQDQSIKGFIKFNNLDKVSAVHIHSSEGNNPILVWLATSNEWENGVAQGTPGANSPCCIPGKLGCTLNAPPGTPLTNCYSNKTFLFQCNPPNQCVGGTCPWISDGLLLNFHGYNFQQVVNGCLTLGTPGADMISSVPYTLISTD
jgi:hypothetical protein